MLLAFNLLIVFAPAVGVLYLDVYETRLLEAQERAMVQQARLVSAAVAELPDQAAIERFFARLERRTESRLRIYDAAGALVADSAHVPEAPADDEGYAVQRARSTRARVLYRLGAWSRMWGLRARFDVAEWVGRRPRPTIAAKQRAHQRYAPRSRAATAQPLVRRRASGR
jgi:hypothetical protein